MGCGALSICLSNVGSLCLRRTWYEVPGASFLDWLISVASCQSSNAQDRVLPNSFFRAHTRVSYDISVAGWLFELREDPASISYQERNIIIICKAMKYIINFGTFDSCRNGPYLNSQVLYTVSYLDKLLRTF